MPRGAIKEAVVVDRGWLMKPKKELKTDEILYYCVQRTTHVQCPASYAIHKNTGAIRIVNPHMNHDIDHLSNSARIARQELKRRAEEGTCREVIDSIRTDFGAEASVAMGNYNSKRRIIQSVKSKKDPDTNYMNDGGPVSQKYSKTIDGSNFLICEKLFNQNRMLIFASDVGIELLSSANVVMVDGTFDCVSDGFTQLFSFHVYISSTVVRPVVFCLFPDKQLATYEEMLEELLKTPQLANWAPELVISDFEVNIKTAFENRFPTCQLHGCLFHLIQSWRRQAEKLKLYDEFTNGSLQSFWQFLKVLPFIDDVNIEHYFGLIVNELPQLVSPELNKYIEYLQRNYITGSPTAPPRFPPSLWSCAVQTVNSIHRTTNAVECWHRLLCSVTTMHNGLSKIKLSDLLQKIKLEDNHTKMDAAELKINPNFQALFHLMHQ